MYNLHCHSLLSDGALLPSEVAVRYLSAGYKVIAITDHADYSNIDFVIDSILRFIQRWPRDSQLKILPGVELTHIPPIQFKPLAKYARSKGVKVIVGHGETLVEPVIKGTNRAALEADIDILAHPGLIADAEVKLAKKKGIFLEITSRKGHRDTNPHVVEQALKAGARLILDTDSHLPEDIISAEQLIKVGRYAGLSRKEIEHIYQDVKGFLKGKGVK
ncbi:MAG: histidinol phosphate phosphatase domain-containing protein [Candidatus Omnitrophica bacterium]|nr:histidinol phosphate phosphatase domain-containing protein [Candidatus Omnitrophota bacterium]MDD5591686.1 histidinol phosphate phosphatase domain-containing protein [Candidatus Omnitrophota bacterium]